MKCPQCKWVTPPTAQVMTPQELLDNHLRAHTFEIRAECPDCGWLMPADDAEDAAALLAMHQVVKLNDVWYGPAEAVREQRRLDDEPCPKCGGDRLRPDFTGSGVCHTARP